MNDEASAPDRQPHGGGPRRRPAIPKIGRGLPSAKCAESPPAEVLRGFDEFNRREFFQQHETLEDAWIAETDPIRYLYQGILQVGVGLYHLGRGNLYGAKRLMERGLILLEPFRPACMGVDVEAFVTQAACCQDAVRALTNETIETFDGDLTPQIRYVD